MEIFILLLFRADQSRYLDKFNLEFDMAQIMQKDAIIPKLELCWSWQIIKWGVASEF